MAQLDPASAAATGILVSVSVFSIGFASVWIHAELSRQLDSTSNLEQQIAQRGAVSDQSIRDSEASSGPQRISAAVLTIVMNGGLVAADLGVLVYWAIAVAGWNHLGLSRIDPVFWPLLAVGAAHVSIVALGVYDVVSVRRALNKVHTDSVAFKLVSAQDLFSKKKYDDAMKIVAPLAARMHGAPWPTRLYGLIFEALGDRRQAMRAFDAALAAAVSLPGGTDLPSAAGKSAARASTSARRSATRSLTCAASPKPTTTSPSNASTTSPSAASATRRWRSCTSSAGAPASRSCAPPRC